MVKEPGPDLDRLIQRKLNGEAKKNTPPYSNARLGMSRSLSETKPEAMNNRIFLTQDLAVSTADRAPRTCDGCGAPLANRNRETASRFCTVCSWRAGKEKIAAATRLEP